MVMQNLNFIHVIIIAISEKCCILLMHAFDEKIAALL